MEKSPSTGLAPVDVLHSPTLLWHDLLLGDRLYLFAWIRFLVAAAIIVGSLFATYVVGVEGLNLPHLAGCAVVLTVFNIALFLAVRRLRQPEQAARATRGLIRLNHLTVTLDFLVLTYLIWLVGGAQSPFLAFYLLHVILAGVTLSRHAAIAYALFGYFLLAGLVVAEGFNWLPRNFPAGAVPPGGGLDARYTLTVLVVYGLLFILAVFLVTHLATSLRKGERRLREANLELERLSAMRRAFLHVALHNLKAPVDTIAMLMSTFSGGLGGPLTEKQVHWLERIEARLREMNLFLRDMQTLAQLETAQIDKLREPIMLAPIVEDVVEEYRERAQERSQTLVVEVARDLAPAKGVTRMVREALVNYVANAIKYSQAGGTIVIRARDAGDRIRLEVQDNGPGIEPADQARLFNDFVRLQAGAEAAGAAGGSGLGLSIVRRIAELHGGAAGVTSQPGQGSVFFLELPISG